MHKFLLLYYFGQADDGAPDDDCVQAACHVPDAESGQDATPRPGRQFTSGWSCSMELAPIESDLVGKMRHTFDRTVDKQPFTPFIFI